MSEFSAERASGIQDTTVANAVANEWDITRNSSVEGNSIGFEDFATEWEASGLGRPPTQSEYENWMEFGSRGQAFNELGNANVEDRDLGELIGNESLSGTNVRFYTTDNDLSSFDGTGFDPVSDGEYVVVPTGTIMNRRSDYIEIGAIDENYTMYVNSDAAKWYEEEWVMYAALAGSIALGGALTPALAGALTNAGAVSALTSAGLSTGAAGVVVEATAGAIVSGVTSGAMAELGGGDFMEGLEEGAISGGISGAARGFAAAKNIQQGTQAYANLQAGSRFASSILTGSDFDDALVSAGAGAVSSFADSDLTASAIEGGAVMLMGGSEEEAINAALMSMARRTISKAGSPFESNDEEPANTVSSKIRDVARSSRRRHEDLSANLRGIRRQVSGSQDMPSYLRPARSIV